MKTDNPEAGPLPDTDTLATIADWRADLSARIRRAELRQELIGISDDEIGELDEEVRKYVRLCKVLKVVAR
jgi:hypothetical protein